MCTKLTYSKPLKVSNLYDAIHVAELEKARARPGLCPRLPLCKVEVIKSPIPSLERGSGSGKVPVRIAACGISRSWCQKYPDEYKKYTHLLNMKEVSKPDISLFLQQHPEPNLHNNATRNDQDCVDDAQITGGGEAVGVGEGGDKTSHVGIWTGTNYDGDEESGAVLEMGYVFSGDTLVGTVGEQEALDSGNEGKYLVKWCLLC
jgi:hypothetical protein